MNAPVRFPSEREVSAGELLERMLRAAHDTEILLSTFVGSSNSAARRAVPTSDQRDEARTIAKHLAAHAATLLALADGSAEPAPAWTADDLGLVIQEAVSNHNDVDGVAWTQVASDVADALGIAIVKEPAARHTHRLTAIETGRVGS